MGLVDAEAIEADWAAALDDAELDSTDCRLMCLSASNGGPTAGHYPPKRELGEDELLTEDAAHTLNAPEVRCRHRVVVVRDTPAGEAGRALLAAKLRHELEHARQWNALGDAPQRLSCLIDAVIDELGVSGREARTIYRAQPNERDANAAATNFVQGRFTAGAIAALAAGDDAVLVATEPGPEPLETLVDRNLHFLLQYADVCSTLPGFLDELAEIDPELLEKWKQLESQSAS